MGSNSQGRVIIGLCMDKERDEELLSFLSSQKNKSEFIRKLLYENLENLKSGDNSFSSNSNMLLSDISITLRNILFTLNNSNHTKNQSFNMSETSITSKTIHPMDIPFDDTDSEDLVPDEDDLILGAVADSFNGF